MNWHSTLVLAAALALPAFSALGTPPGGLVNISNQGDESIVSVYASVCDANVWGGNLLTGGTLVVGEDVEIILDPGCWDLKAVTAAGIETAQLGVLLDDAGELTWIINPN